MNRLNGSAFFSLSISASNIFNEVKTSFMVSCLYIFISILRVLAEAQMICIYNLKIYFIFREIIAKPSGPTYPTRLLGRHMYKVFKFSESKQEPNRQYFQLLRLVHKTVKSMHYIPTFLLIPEDVCLFR